MFNSSEGLLQLKATLQHRRATPTSTNKYTPQNSTQRLGPSAPKARVVKFFLWECIDSPGL
jgi:hypothetical protein